MAGHPKVTLRQTIWLDCSVLGCHRRVGNKGLYTTPCCWEITYGYRTRWCCCTPISIADSWIDLFRACSKTSRNYLFVIWQVAYARSLRTACALAVSAYEGTCHWIIGCLCFAQADPHNKPSTVIWVCPAATNSSYTARRMMETLEMLPKGQPKGINSKILTILGIYHRLSYVKVTWRLNVWIGIGGWVKLTWNIRIHQQFLMQWQLLFHQILWQIVMRCRFVA